MTHNNETYTCETCGADLSELESMSDSRICAICEMAMNDNYDDDAAHYDARADSQS